MTRVLAALIVADMILFVASGVLGLLVDGDRLYPEHFILALLTAFVTVLTHVVVFTYFAAAGRMVSQAVLIGHLDREPLMRCRRLKSRATACVGVGVGTLVALIAFGSLVAQDHGWHVWHLVAALIALVANAGAFYVEYVHVATHSRLMTEVVAAYNVARAADTDKAPTTPDV